MSKMLPVKSNSITWQHYCICFATLKTIFESILKHFQRFFNVGEVLNNYKKDVILTNKLSQVNLYMKATRPHIVEQLNNILLQCYSAKTGYTKRLTVQHDPVRLTVKMK